MVSALMIDHKLGNENWNEIKSVMNGTSKYHYRTEERKQTAVIIVLTPLLG